MRLTLAAVVCLLCVARAHAKPPACFPERTVLWAATLVDAEGNAFAGVRAGQVVRVVDDAAGENGKLAEIELDGPVKLRGLVSRRQLLVFARGEIVIEPNESWLIEEAPLWIDSGDDAQAIVKRAEPHGSPSRFSRVRAACSQLRGTPPKKLFESDCHGASHASPTRVSGRLVEFDEPPKLESVSGRVSAPDTTRFGLLERRGFRALVEYVDEWGEWTRIVAGRPRRA